MAQAAQKIVLDTGCEIALNMLVTSPTNVRRTHAETGIEDLAEDIARRGLLHNLVVRPIADAEGAETGMYAVEAGGRRLRALQWLSRRKRLAKNAPIRCIISTEDVPEETSLAENWHRALLHPLDEFRAFHALHEKGRSEGDIAAIYKTEIHIVRQRLRLAAVSDALLDAYAEEALTLDQLMAFTVTPDKARQEQVWKALRRGFNDSPFQIRRLLTEKTVPAGDRRARFVSLETYDQAGGAVLRDLFSDDNGGWLHDVGLLDRLVSEKLKALAETVAAEGWKWIDVAIDFPYGHTDDLRRLAGVPADLTKKEKKTFEALTAEYAKLDADYAGADDLPDEIDERLGELEDVLSAFDSRPAIYATEDMARAGVFISIDRDGAACIERGYVRAEDEPAAESEAEGENEADEDQSGADGSALRASISIGGKSIDEEEDDGAVKPLSDRLVAELTAHRTLALRDAVAQNPRAAMTLLLHKLCADYFLHGGQYGCLEANVQRVALSIQGPDLKDCAPAKAIAERHDAWAADAPKDEDALWSWLDALDEDSRAALLAHLVSFGVTAVQERANPYGGPSAQSLRRRVAQADRLARAVHLDMIEAGWRVTVENYLGRVPKPRILEAVREAKGEQSAGLIDHLKKADMATEAARLLADTGWLPEPLRLDDPGADAAALPAFLDTDAAPARAA